LIGTSSDPPSRAQAEEFLGRWTGSLPARFEWFCSVAGSAGIAPDLSTGSLVPLLRFVGDRVGEPQPAEDPPLWYREVHAARLGWSPYGAMLVDGLTAYVAELYQVRLGEDRTRWVLNTDPRDADYLQPTMAEPLLTPPWLQVRTSVNRLRGSGQVDGLLRAVEKNLGVLGRPEPEESPPAAVEQLVEVTSVGRRRWQVSFPEDIAELLGAEAYARLECGLATVEGVTAATMEDRDRAMVSTRRGVGQADLEARLTRVVEGLAG
jgi:hypothetical protein